MITKNEIYTVLATALREQYGDFYCVQGYEPVPRSIPCMYFREFHMRPAPTINFEFTEDVKDSTVYIELYLEHNDEVDSDEVIKFIEDIMGSLYYIEEMCNQIDNIDISIDRYSIRFFRKLCGGDTE